MMGVDRRMLRDPLGFGRGSPPPGVPCFASPTASAQSPLQCSAQSHVQSRELQVYLAAAPCTAPAVLLGTALGKWVAIGQTLSQQSSVFPEGRARDQPPNG